MLFGSHRANLDNLFSLVFALLRWSSLVFAVVAFFSLVFAGVRCAFTCCPLVFAGVR
jgi:hypothetical protein